MIIYTLANLSYELYWIQCYGSIYFWTFKHCDVKINKQIFIAQGNAFIVEKRYKIEEWN